MDQDGFDSVWDEIKNVFGLDGRNLATNSHISSSSVLFIKSENLGIKVLAFLQAEVEFRLREFVVPPLWTFFASSDLQTISDVQKSNVFKKVIFNYLIK